MRTERPETCIRALRRISSKPCGTLTTQVNGQRPTHGSIDVQAKEDQPRNDANNRRDATRSEFALKAEIVVDRAYNNQYHVIAYAVDSSQDVYVCVCGGEGGGGVEWVGGKGARI